MIQHKKIALAFRLFATVLLVVFASMSSSLAQARTHHRGLHNAHSSRHQGHHVATSRAYSPTFAGFVMDLNTGQVLYQNNADQPLHPASLTKIMTLLLVFEALDKGEMNLHDRITVSYRAAAMAPSKLGLRPGASISVQDAIYAVVTKSCNDIAVALAENMAGSENAFARRMTARARDLGLSHTIFVNASGLPDARQYSSARDMARLARYVITTYPGYYKYYSTRNFYYAGEYMHNHNNLMNSYPGMDGMKTGYTEASGFNLVASAVRDRHRLIGVVFGGKTANSRNQQVAQLLDAGFEKLEHQVTAPVFAANGGVGNAPSNTGHNVKTDQVLAPPLLADAAHVQTGPQQNAAPLPAGQQTASLSPSISQPENPQAVAATGLVSNQKDPTSSSASASQNTSPNWQTVQANIVSPGVLTQPTGSANAEEEQETEQPSDQPETLETPTPHLLRASLPDWAIQIGAFSSRAATTKALAQIKRQLPVKYASINPTIAPYKTQDGWIYRARLHGLSKIDAERACHYISTCVPVAPRSN